jgi:hypothetical protein
MPAPFFNAYWPSHRVARELPYVAANEQRAPDPGESVAHDQDPKAEEHTTSAPDWLDENMSVLDEFSGAN